MPPTLITPEGTITGWKKLRDGLIAKISIPETARRHNATGRKCRAEYADVIAIYDHEGNEVSEGRSSHDPEFVYRPGERVMPDSFEPNRFDVCAPGIHFFITRAEAEDY